MMKKIQLFFKNTFVYYGKAAVGAYVHYPRPADTPKVTFKSWE